MNSLLSRAYFLARPLLPTRLRVAMRRRLIRGRLRRQPDLWPIDPAAGRVPDGWAGWPDHKRFAVVLTHDVESKRGLDRIRPLADLERSLGYRSSYNLVPLGSYDVPPEIRRWLVEAGFEVGVHDLHHDGSLYRSHSEFQRRAARINGFLREWNAVGFRSAFMLHKLEWLHALDIEYDASTFDTDPFEPQPDGATTIFPFWVPRPGGVADPLHRRGHPAAPSAEGRSGPCGYLELPYTLVQDISLFIILGHTSDEIWRRKLDWIVERGGMALLNVHPDYVDFAGNSGTSHSFPASLYAEFLRYIRKRYGDTFWHALPREVARHVREAYHGTGPRQPRHICMLTYSHFEQDGRIRAYAGSLVERGDIVDVLSIGQPQAPAQTSPPAATPGVRIIHVQDRRRDERHPADYLVRFLLFCWRSSRLLSRLQRLRRFDLVHSHNVPDFIVFAASPAKMGAPGSFSICMTWCRSSTAASSALERSRG